MNREKHILVVLGSNNMMIVKWAHYVHDIFYKQLSYKQQYCDHEDVTNLSNFSLNDSILTLHVWKQLFQIRGFSRGKKRNLVISIWLVCIYS